MSSKVISFRVPEDLYEEFVEKCESGGIRLSEKLKDFVDNACYPPKAKETTLLQGDALEGIVVPSEADKEEATSLCPECKSNVGWLELPLVDGPLSFLSGHCYRICPACNHQERMKK